MKAEYINVKRGDVESKKFNIFVGISLGNLFFSKENMRGYIEWALENTKDDVVVMIADDIQAINYQVLKNLSKEESLAKSKEQGDEKERSIKKITSIFSEEDRSRVKVIRWEEVASIQYSKKVDAIFKEFEENADFRKAITDVVLNAFGEKLEGLKDNEVLRLSEYILNELPLMSEGLSYGEKFYAVMPYPKRTPLDDIIEKIHEEKFFPELFSKILENKRKIVVLK